PRFAAQFQRHGQRAIGVVGGWDVRGGGRVCHRIAPVFRCWRTEGLSDVLAANPHSILTRPSMRQGAAIDGRVKPHRHQDRDVRVEYSPPPLEGGGWGEGFVRPEPLPPTPSLKGRGRILPPPATYPDAYAGQPGDADPAGSS